MSILVLTHGMYANCDLLIALGDRHDSAFVMATLY